MSKVQVSLYGDDAERFEEVRETLADRHGFEPTNAATLRHLMGQI